MALTPATPYSLPGVTTVQDTGNVSGVNVCKAPLLPAIGAVTARIPGFDRVRPGMRIWLSSQAPGGQWFSGHPCGALDTLFPGLAGLLPAIRAARLSPAEALSSI